MNLQPQNPHNPLLSPSLGWLFVGLSGFFLLGLLPRVARSYYPQGGGIAARAAAPVLFAALAAASFGGWGIEALGVVAIGGIVLIIIGRRTGRRREQDAKSNV